MSKGKSPSVYPELEATSPAFAALVTNQQKFAVAYMKHFNASKAMRDAGYSDKCCTVEGCRLLAKPSMQAAIKELMPQIGITPERISSALAEIAFGADPADYEDLVSGKTTLSDLRATGVSTTQIKTIKLRRHKEKSHIGKDDKEVESETVDTEIRLYDRLSALDKLAKVLGMMESKTELVGGLSITVDMKFDESRAPRAKS